MWRWCFELCTQVRDRLFTRDRIEAVALTERALIAAQEYQDYTDEIEIKSF